MTDYLDFDALEKDEQKRILEALIFAGDAPMNENQICAIIYDIDEKSVLGKAEYIITLIDELNNELEERQRPYQIVKIAGGYQFATRNEYGEIVKKLLKNRVKKRLSPASMETLAIIAYRQPITKAEIELIRGVNSAEVVNTLADKELVVEVGKKESIGKPSLYGTTLEFLKRFGLNSLNDLPPLDVLSEALSEIPELDEEISENKNEEMFTENNEDTNKEEIHNFTISEEITNIQGNENGNSD